MASEYFINHTIFRAGLTALNSDIKITKYDDLNSTVYANSASWGTGGVTQNLIFDEITKDLSLTSGNTVSLSTFGTGTDTGVRLLTANWDSTYTAVNSNSANWQTTYTASSAYVTSDITGIANATALDNMMQITQAGYNAITPAANTLYIIVG
jgi:hypothetical protein